MNRNPRLTLAVFCILVFCLGSGYSFSQDRSNSQDRPNPQDRPTEKPPREKTYGELTRALPQQQSRAEAEAEQLVSLSADKIISILNDEPGLLLECKKILVRTSFEQGRLLSTQDLDDDVVFRLVRDDANVRVLFTREIENRSYVRAKPTREELARQKAAAPSQSIAGLPPGLMGAQAGGMRSTQNQEDSYWSDRQGDNSSGLPGSSGLPQQNQGTPAIDPRRALLLAQAQQNGINLGSLSSDSGAMQGVSPDQLSALLATSASGQGQGGGLNRGGPDDGASASGLGQGFNMGSLMGGGDLSVAGGLGLGPTDAYAGNGDESAPEASRPGTRLRPPVLESKQPTLTHAPNPYADVPSLYDLYAQYQRRSPTLDRFGQDIFRNGTGNLSSLPMDLPVGPDYVLGPGDGVNIDLFGSVGERLRRVVTPEGQIALPDFGNVQVAGKTMGDVQHMVQAALRTQYRNVEADISITRLRSIRVYVVGDVERPGAYDVSALSTPLNALYEAGGPTSHGSLRIVKQYRGKQLVQQVDLYDLLLHGVNADLQRLESGDTLLVPPIGPEVTVEGMVRRPAIYELNGEKNLAEVLQVAGGVLPSGTLRHVDVQRVEAHESRTMLRLDIPETNNQESVTQTLESFAIQDGDKIQISPILPYADKTVYVEGHVFRPGKFAYRDGMKVTDLIKSYKDLLPEPYKEHAEIVRLKAPDNSPEILAFNLDDALAGKDQDIVLQPFDTIRVFGRFDFEDAPVVTVTGAVRDPGDHVTNGATYLRDAVFLAGNVTSDAQIDDAQVFRKTADGKLEVLSVNLAKALDGDPASNLLLQPKDRVFVHKNLNKTDPPTVSVEGEVARPGKYPLGENMTAAGLVRLAGGLKRSAFTEEADLTRYEVAESSKIVSDHVDVPIAKALADEPDADVRLRDGDVLTIRQLTGWTDVGATITVKGEVLHPGTYGIQEGERLSSIIERAGGFRKEAYPYGVVFERSQVRQLQEQNRLDLIRRVQSEAAEVKVVPGMDEDQQMTAQAATLQYKTTLEKLENTPPAGRLVIHISSNMKRWQNTSADIQVRNGDSIYVPKRPNIVLVDGAVYNPTAITFKAGKNAGWYLKQAGGPTQLANKKSTFVIRADGSVVGGSAGLFNGGVESAELQPGDMVVVPEKAYSINNKWKTTLESAQLIYAVGIAIQVARSF
jgi:protein involved in polysaccharide export with SLBB domain